MTTNWIYRADITGVDSNGTATVFRYATQAYTTSPSHPTLPNTTFENRLTQPLQLFRDLYGQLRTHGSSQIAHGTTELQNADGGLDFLLNYAFDTQKIEIYRIDPTALDTEVLEHRLFMESLTLDDTKVTVLVRDASYVFDRALQPTKYAGNNSLPTGLEGTSSDLKGKPKPKCWGKNFNLQPDLVNTSQLVYQFHDSSVAAGFVTAVYDKRTPLGAGQSCTLNDIQNTPIQATVSSIDTVTDIITTLSPLPASTGDAVHVASTASVPGGLLNNRYYYMRVVSSTQLTLHPTANDAANNTNIVNITDAGSGTITVAKNRTPYGMYDWCFDNSGSYIRLGSAPQGKVTMDTSNSGSNAWYDCLSWLLGSLNISGFTFSVDNRVSASYQDIGVYWTDEMTVYEAIQQIISSVGGSLQCYTSRTGSQYQVFVTVQRLEAPTSTTVLSIGQANIAPGSSLKLLQLQDDERGIPAWRITCDYKLNRTLMSGSDIAGAAAADIAFCASDYRSTQIENSAIKQSYPGSPEIIVKTLLATESDATLHGQYMRTICGVLGYHAYSLTIPMELIDALTTGSVPQVPGLMLAQNVNVTYPRFTLTSGANLSILGITLDYQARTVDLTLWG